MKTLIVIISGVIIGCAGAKPTKSVDFYLFSEVTEKPMFKECIGVNKKSQEECFKKQLEKHIVDNFSYPVEAAKKNIQGKVNVSFTITKDGIIRIDNVEGPDPILEEMAKNIFYKLPPLTPGKIKGKPVEVLYNYPLYFKLD